MGVPSYSHLVKPVCNKFRKPHAQWVSGILQTLGMPMHVEASCKKLRRMYRASFTTTVCCTPAFHLCAVAFLFTAACSLEPTPDHVRSLSTALTDPPGLLQQGQHGSYL